MQNDTVIAVDVAKAIFEVAVSDRPGHVCRRDRPPRAQFLAFFVAYPGAIVVMEACGSRPRARPLAEGRSPPVPVPAPGLAPSRRSRRSHVQVSRHQR